MANKKTKKYKTVNVSNHKRSLSAPVIQHIRLLSEQIGEIVPATSFKKGAFCFQTLAHKYGLNKHWPAQGSKKERIFDFLSKVYRSHPKIFYKIFRENLPRGIERRHKSGNPVLFDEIDNLNKTLKSLNVNLDKEIKALNLPKERPAIVPPPFDFQKMVDSLLLHPFLQPDCVKLFKDGHINESIRKSLEKYESYIQKKSSLQKIGNDLMASAFNEKDPLIKIANTDERRGAGLQEGFKFLSMGSMGFWKNFCSHGDERQLAHQDAIAILATVSFFLNYIDNNS